jgi:two-component system sensor histidine kinase RegB
VTTLHATARERDNPSADNLRNLLVIRSIALLGQTGVLAYVMLVSRTTESPVGIIASLAALALVTVVSLWRCTGPWPVTDQEFLAQLLVDVAGWSCLMYFSGGANNPFISYYLVPLVISAAVLPWRYTWLVAGASLAGYSLLLYHYVPFPLFTPHHHPGAGTSVHVLGMWFNFLFSAGLITYFVVRMAATLRRQEAEAVARREDTLRNEQIMAVASLAAGTAHALGTPLSTIGVLLEELQQDPALATVTREDYRLMEAQLVQCKTILGELTRTAELTSTEQKQVWGLADWVNATVERWSVRRPGVRYTIQAPAPAGAPRIAIDATLSQALENLLDNAANTGSDTVAVKLTWDDQQIAIAVRDHGPGIAQDVLQRMGKPVVQASEGGLGLGLLLSHATVERYGGSIELGNAPGGGTIATLRLPRAGLEVDHA